MAKTKQLKAAAQAVPKSTKTTAATQACPPKPKSDWQCVKYGNGRGPKYANKDNAQPLSSYTKWDQLIRDGKLTQNDVKVMKLMSPNEGDFNSVQAYDSEAITAGAMQKTINSSGTGELFTQIKEFKTENPTKYDELFAQKGWKVEDVTTTRTVGKGKKQRTVTTTTPQIQYTYTDENGETVTVKNTELKAFIRAYCDPDTPPAKKAAIEKALDSMRQATEDDAFKEKQLLDFKSRIGTAVGQKPAGYDYPISDYMSSPKGQALVLDQSVNRPAYVDNDFGGALDSFYKDNPKVSKNPTEWGENRATYEDAINKAYGPNRRGTDMVKRYGDIRDSTVPDDVPITTPTPP